MSYVSSFNMEVSPDEIFLFNDKGVESCETLFVKVSEDVNLLIEDRWAREGYLEKNLVNHTLSSKELLLSTNFKKEVFSSGFSRIDICFNAKEAGIYHGVILIRAEGKPVGVGTWVNLNVSEKSSFITGLSIKSSQKDGGNNLFLLILVGLVFVLFIVWLIVKISNH